MKNYFQIRHRRILRECFRGYNKLKASKNFSFIRSVKNNLTKIKLSKINNRNAYFIAQHTDVDPELVVRQYVLQFYTGQKFVRAFFRGLGANKPACLALPKDFRDFLFKRGIQSNQIQSALLWTLELFFRLANGLIFFFRTACINFTSRSSEFILDEHYSYFDDLSLVHLPSASHKTYDVMTWYSKIEQRDKRMAIFKHSVSASRTRTENNISIEYQPRPFHQIKGIKNNFYFIVWGFLAAVSAIKDLFLGRWWHALLFKEIVMAKAVQLSCKKSFAKEYLFHFSSNIYRPLWTYLPEAHGAKIICYFYSSFDQLKNPDIEETHEYEWSPTTWPKFLVWDYYQKEMLARIMPSNTELIVCGPAYFSDSSSKIPNATRPVIAVFNVDPHRKSSHFGISTIADYYANCPAVNYLFLIDIAEVTKTLGVNIYIKLKRDVGKRLPRSYRKCLSKIMQFGNVTIVPSDVSPFRLIENSDAVLSAPFSSPTIFGKYLDRPAAYYDAGDWINPNDPASRGQPILQGREQLERWIKESFEQIVDETEVR